MSDPWFDQPERSCPLIDDFLICWGDGIHDPGVRTRLLGPLVPLVVGTRSTPDVEIRRAFLALDWLVLVYTPAWLDLIESCRPHAAALRALPEIVDDGSADTAHGAVNSAWAAVKIANARIATNDAATNTAAANAANSAAAGAAARTAAEAGDDYAWAAASGWFAAKTSAAAGYPLAPTVSVLQDEAVRLVKRMIAVPTEED